MGVVPERSGDRLGPLLGVAGLLLGTPVFVAMVVLAYATVFIVGWPWTFGIVAAASGALWGTVRAVGRRREMSLLQAAAALVVVVQAALLDIVALLVVVGMLTS